MKKLVVTLLIGASAGCAITDRTDLLTEGGLRLKLVPEQGASIPSAHAYSRGGKGYVEGLVKLESETGPNIGGISVERPDDGTTLGEGCYAPISGPGPRTANLRPYDIASFKVPLKEIPPAGTVIHVKPIPFDPKCARRRL